MTDPSSVAQPSTKSPQDAREELPPDFEKWLEHFYKECGREVTLAYTTLNQMKNWAVLVVAAVVSAVVALSKAQSSTQGAPASLNLIVYAGSLIVYVFVLRFFIRAILCYINLVRWNNLQSAILEYKLVQRDPRGGSLRSAEDLRDSLLKKIQDLYFSWRAPSELTRKAQLFANLKLGFALLLALPVFFSILSGVTLLPRSAMARGLTVFAVGVTFVEFIDFWRAKWFDTPEVSARRKRGKDQKIFPTPVSDGEYLSYWVATVVLSIVVCFWPEISAYVGPWISAMGGAVENIFAR